MRKRTNEESSRLWSCFAVREKEKRRIFGPSRGLIVIKTGIRVITHRERVIPLHKIQEREREIRYI